MFEIGLKIFLVSGLLLNIIWVLDAADIIKTPFWKDRNNELNADPKMDSALVKENYYNERFDSLDKELKEAKYINEKLAEEIKTLDSEIEMANDLVTSPCIKSDKIIYLDDLKS